MQACRWAYRILQCIFCPNKLQKTLILTTGSVSVLLPIYQGLWRKNAWLGYGSHFRDLNFKVEKSCFHLWSCWSKGWLKPNNTRTLKMRPIFKNPTFKSSKAKYFCFMSLSLSHTHTLHTLSFYFECLTTLIVSSLVESLLVTFHCFHSSIWTWVHHSGRHFFPFKAYNKRRK